MSNQRNVRNIEERNQAEVKHPGFEGASYPLAMRAAEIGMWDLDLCTDRVMICENLAPLVGLPPHPHDLFSTEWHDMLVPDDLQNVKEHVERTCSTAEHFNVEFRIRHDSGRIVWLQSRGEVRRNVEGQATHIVGVCLDITDRKQAEEAVRESEGRFRSLADASPDGIFVNCAGKFVYANHAAARIMGLRHPRELTNFTPENFVDPQLLQSVEATVRSQLQHSQKTKPVMVPFRRLDRSEAIAEVTYGRVMWKGENALQILVRDVTEQQAAEHKLRVMNERLKLVMEGTGEGIWDYDPIAGLYELSGGVNAILGYPEHAIPRQRAEWLRIIHPDDRQRARSAIRAALAGETVSYRCEYRVRACDGSWKWVLARGVVVARDEPGVATAMTGSITDITAKRESEEVVWRHANLDPLTGLPNRRNFIDTLESELRRVSRTRTTTALLFIDLDGFKQVNDLFGHETGDLLLMEASYRIRQAARDTDCLGRLGGDEFTLLLKDLPDPRRVEFVCQNILARLSEPFAVGSEYAYISASIGVALSPMDATTAEELLRKADTAMYSAKSAGKNQFSYFAQSMDERAHTRLRMSAELRQAIGTGQLSLCYQPIIDLHDGHVAKAEALLRWVHPKMGRVFPADFIPIAEEAGLISEIGNWVFREVARYAKRWSTLTGTPVKVGLNMSPAQFSRRYMESDWLQYLHDLDLSPSSIVVEITEGLLLNATDEVNKKLLEYRDAGIQVAIDDFGTGYSSMAYIKEFDIDYLKIDQSFIRGIPANPGHCVIAESIIVMAHKLGQQVIAEGIETREQADFLIRAGCDFGQGFYFSPPVPAGQIDGLWSRHYL